MRHVSVVSLVAFLLAATGGLASAAPSGSAKIPATKAGVLVLADRYLEAVTPNLTPAGKDALREITFTLDSQRNVPTILASSIGELVNQCTIGLGRRTGIDVVLVVTSQLVKHAPENPRVANLMGMALHAIGKDDEAVPALEYARTLAPKNELIMVNLANVHLRRERDEEAKGILDAVLKQNDKNKSAWAAMATYWYRKGNMRRTVDALVKSAKFGGFKRRNKARKNSEVVEKHKVSPDDPPEIAEKKLEQVKGLVPMTTADLIDDVYPDVAKQIRDRYGKLMDEEKMIMPPLPQLNVSGVRGWKAQGRPHFERWMEGFMQNYGKAQQEIIALETGINPGDSKAEKRAKGKAAGKKKAEKSMADAQRMLEQMEGMPGVSPAQIAQIRARMKETAAKKGLELPPEPSGEGDSGEGAPGASPRVDEYDEIPAGFDHGSMFAVTNHRDYLGIRMGYESYFRRYFEEVGIKLDALRDAYQVKMSEETGLFIGTLNKIYEERVAAYKACVDEGSSQACVAPLSPNPDGDPKYDDLEVRAEKLRHKKAVNALGDDFVGQWAGLALPQYERKMKPKLDEFWAVCGLYVRNMNDPEVMKTEYVRVKQIFWAYAERAVAGIAADFAWEGETYEEELGLAILIKQAEEEAKAKLYERHTKRAESALEAWLKDNLVIGIDAEFIGFKISPRGLEIETYLAGMNFKHTFDFEKETWTTERSFAAKADIGFHVGPLDIGISARADILRSYDTYNIRSGKLVECGSRFAEGSLEGKVKVGPATAGQKLEVALDPAADSELSAKVTGSAGFEF